MAVTHLKGLHTLLSTRHLRSYTSSGIFGFGNQKTQSVLISFFRTKSTNAVPASEVEELDDPIKYSTSKASEWTAKKTHIHDTSYRWNHQPLVVTLSVVAFCVYFFILREENDMDQEIEKPIWQKVPGLERKQLEVVLQYNEENQLPTEDIINRLQEIDKVSATINAK